MSTRSQAGSGEEVLASPLATGPIKGLHGRLAGEGNLMPQRLPEVLQRFCEGDLHRLFIHM
jgi:hypothetical protein